MSRFQKICVLLTMGLIFSCQPPKPKEEKPVQVDNFPLFIAHFESLFKTHFKASGCPGAAAVIVKDSSIVWMKCFGVKQEGKEDPIDAHTMFRIASLSKGFSGILTGILVEKKLLNWEDPVIQYLPDFQLKDTAQTRRIKIKHLLSHTTGLPRHVFTNKIEDKQSLHDMMLELKKVDLEGEEGKFFGYQNLGFSLIMEIVKAKTGRSFEDWMKTEIFQKAGMSTASMSYEELIAMPNRSMGHSRQADKGYMPVAIHDRYYNVAAAGGINASITDMAQWLQVILGNRPDIVSTTTLDYVFTPFIEPGKDEYFDLWDGVEHSYYGMGWRIVDFNGERLICHGGFVNDFRSEIAIDRKNRLGICVLFNAQNSYASVVVPSFFTTHHLYKALAN